MAEGGNSRILYTITAGGSALATPSTTWLPIATDVLDDIYAYLMTLAPGENPFSTPTLTATLGVYYDAIEDALIMEVMIGNYVLVPGKSADDVNTVLSAAAILGAVLAHLATFGTFTFTTVETNYSGEDALPPG